MRKLARSVTGTASTEISAAAPVVMLFFDSFLFSSLFPITIPLKKHANNSISIIPNHTRKMSFAEPGADVTW